jgi:hypothetical protein
MKHTNPTKHTFNNVRHVKPDNHDKETKTDLGYRVVVEALETRGTFINLLLGGAPNALDRAFLVICVAGHGEGGGCVPNLSVLIPKGCSYIRERGI